MASFEEQMTALESVVERLERGELSLDESVRLFEEGVRLSRSCKDQLDAAEGKVEMLTEQGVSGKLKPTPITLEVNADDDTDR